MAEGLVICGRRQARQGLSALSCLWAQVQPQMGCIPSAHPTHPASGVLGGWALHACLVAGAASCLHLSLCSCPRWGGPSAHGILVQASWEAAAHRAQAHPGCLCRLQLVLALTMHQPPWHRAAACSGLAPRLVPLSSGSLHCAARLPLLRGSPGLQVVLGCCSGLTWIHGSAGHQGLRGKSHACICLQGSRGAGLGWDMVFGSRSREAQSLRRREGCCIRSFCLAGVESPQENPVKE